MRYITAILFCCFFINSLKGQDLIITNSNDSIACKITRLSDQYIHYIEKQQIRSRISLQDVASYEWDSAKKNTKSEKTAIVEPPIIANEDTTKRVIRELSYQIPDPPLIRLSVSGGNTRQIGGYSGFEDAYIKKATSLRNFGGSVHLYSSEYFGIGIKYNRAWTSIEHDFIQPIILPLGNVNSIDEEIRFSYLGLSFLGRQSFNQKHFVYYGATLGIVNYRANGVFNDGSNRTPFIEDGDALGTAIMVGYDFKIVELIGIGLEIEVNIAQINTITSNNALINGNNGPRIIPDANFDVSRVDITAGLRFLK